MNTAKNMTSSAVSAFANIPAVSETVDNTFNMPGFTKQASEYLQNKLQPPPPPTPPKAAEKWLLLAKVVGGIVAIVVLYFIIDCQTKTPQVGSAPLSAEDELSKMEPYGKSKRGWMFVSTIAVALLAVVGLYLRHRFAKMFSGSPARSSLRELLSSRRSYYPPRSCRYQLKTK